MTLFTTTTGGEPDGTRRARATGTQRGGSMGRVLIVDDHEDIRRMFARAVRACGHEALTAPDGEEAVATATEQRPGLIVLDLMMPGITGFDVLRSLRADPRT